VLSSEHCAAPTSAQVYLEPVTTNAATTCLEVLGELLDELGRGLKEQVLGLLDQGQALKRTRLRQSLAVKNERLGEVLELLELAGRLCRGPAGCHRPG
jgi:hypothetical protein